MTPMMQKLIVTIIFLTLIGMTSLIYYVISNFQKIVAL